MNERALRVLEYEKIRDMLKHHVSSSIGKTLIMRMKPLRDEGIIRIRIAETSEARYALHEYGNAPLGGLHDIKDNASRAQKSGVLQPLELLDIADTAAAIRRLRKYLLGLSKENHLLLAQGKLLSEFPKIEKSIDIAINASAEVVDSASPELEKARRRLKSLADSLQRELQRVISSPGYVEYLQDSILTQRNGRFCVPVRAECRNAFKGIVHDVSASGQTVFMEPLNVVELGNELREAEQQERDEVQRVLSRISNIVGDDAKRLIDCMETAGRVDVIFSRALFAHEISATEPELNNEGVTELIQARHPLLGRVAVPIDISIGTEGNSSLLITGPNTGGKSVTLKTVGILTLMAQSGLHIPAAPGSRIAIFEKIFADLGDEQSIEQSLSTFSGHMTNIVGILKEADSNSLVLLDEIGAGTDPAEGAALAKAILLTLHEQGCRTIATTHYGELKVFGQNTDGFANASVEFDLNTLRPTYRVIPGLPGSSNALAISQRLGLPKPIISRAKELIGDAPQAMEQVLKQAEGVRRALDRERTTATKARIEAEKQLEALTRMQREFDEQREALLRKSREKSQEVLHNARVQANELLEELKMAVRDARAFDSGKAQVNAGELRKKTREVFGTLNEQVASLPAPLVAKQKPQHPALTSVTAGDTVYVHSIGHRGVALTSGKGDESVEVQVGIMRVHVPVKDLEARGTKAETAPVIPHDNNSQVVEKELLLLGKRAEEAAAELVAYLYDALEAGFQQVRIVHGFGTGALRNVVRDILRSHPAVAGYRTGDRAEGGGGVTVATLG